MADIYVHSNIYLLNREPWTKRSLNHFFFFFADDKALSLKDSLQNRIVPDICKIENMIIIIIGYSSARIYKIFNSTLCICGNELHICCWEPAQTGITTCAIQEIHPNLHNTQQNKLTEKSNIIQSKVKHSSLELSCSLYSQAQVLISCLPSSTMFNASLSVSCTDHFVPVRWTKFSTPPRKGLPMYQHTGTCSRKTGNV